MVNDVSRALIGELLDLDINYSLTEQEINCLIPFFEFLETCKRNKIIKIIGESVISKHDSSVQLETSSFTGENIQQVLETKIQEYGICIQLQTPTGSIKICIFGESEKDINHYKKSIINTIIFILQLNIKENKLNSINIYLTELKKKVDKKDIFDHQKNISLSGDQVNTGVTYHYPHKSDIYLWRKEEIIKVCIHELIHSLQWDFNFDDNTILNIFKKKLNIKKNIVLTEAYTEAWAEIINCYICATNIETNPIEIFSRFIHYIELETIFSIWQIIKIINISSTENKCSVDNFINITDNNTNVFPYYFLTASILFNIADWMCLCMDVCNNFINYNNNDKNNILMGNWLVNSITDKHFYTLCKKIKKNCIKKNGSFNQLFFETMRMTLIECI